MLKLTKAQKKALTDIAIAESRKLKRDGNKKVTSKAHTRTLSALEACGLIIRDRNWYKAIVLTNAGRKVATWLLIDRAREEMEYAFKARVIQFLNGQDACDEAIEFIHTFNSFEQAYIACNNGEWLDWLYTQLNIETPDMKAAREQWVAAWEQLASAREPLGAIYLAQKLPWPIVEEVLKVALEQEAK